MILPKMPITLPACLEGQLNGKLPAALLVDTPGLAGGPTVRLVEPAARSWRALADAAGRAGIVLRATSIVDSYRPYVVQFNVFIDRYWPDPEPGFIGERYWAGHYDLQGRWVAGRTWYQKPNTAVAAVPGSSNHGRGLAVDVANAAGARLAWLLAHAAAYGWSWEIDSEPWHIRHCAGDDLTAAVRLYERSLQEDDMAQVLVRFADDPAEPDQVWLCDGQLRRRVKPAWLGTGNPLNGPIGNLETHFRTNLGNLGGGGVVLVSKGDKDVWGIDIATLQGDGASTVVPMDLSEAAKADIRTIVDQELDEQSRAGADAD